MKNVFINSTIIVSIVLFLLAMLMPVTDDLMGLMLLGIGWIAAWPLLVPDNRHRRALVWVLTSSCLVLAAISWQSWRSREHKRIVDLTDRTVRQQRELEKYRMHQRSPSAAEGGDKMGA